MVFQFTSGNVAFSVYFLILVLVICFRRMGIVSIPMRSRSANSSSLSPTTMKPPVSYYMFFEYIDVLKRL